ncbi:hypothetical protein FHP25_25100 [Vineibacter terrae]|uniref:DNA ligase (ATP) n=1 Tax=Vineibacter terrae TaxID=2586908 RepID=A0A5C8PFM3_9HYPH|nr:non-homologous end-joining DNA ligase [Vineibacter terrae]TXL72577.1 hypothetical protein FHP25_25100 [Vineibacter terrae]
MTAPPSISATWPSGSKPGRRSCSISSMALNKPRAVPAFIEPQLATLVDDVPAGKAWVYEIKYDGYRTLVAADGPAVRCYSRTGLDWTGRYPAAALAIAALKLRDALLDGEMAVFDADGRTSFAGLQDALKRGGANIAFCAFDLLRCDGEDLRRRPLVERKARLAELLDGAPASLIYSAHLDKGGARLHSSLCRRGYEGIVAKRGDKPYASGRSKDWLKIKCVQEQEFVVAGFMRSDARLPFASLILALHDKDGLRYSGHVGTGFSDAERSRLRAMFRSLERATPPVTGVLPAEVRRKATWIEPRLVVQVAFTELTADGLVRHPSYRGIREDKPAREVRAEVPARPRRKPATPRSARMRSG